jgi:hypothetical protein
MPELVALKATVSRSVVFQGFSVLRRPEGDNLADVDQIVRDDAQSNPLFHSLIAFVTTPIQTVPPLEHTDPPFASGAPGLRFTKPPLLL